MVYSLSGVSVTPLELDAVIAALEARAGRIGRGVAGDAMRKFIAIQRDTLPTIAPTVAP